MQIVLWRDFAGVIKVLPTLTSWQGDDLGGPDLISWALKDWEGLKFHHSLALKLKGTTWGGMWMTWRSWEWSPADSQLTHRDITPVATRNGTVPTIWVALKADSSSQSSQTRVQLSWHFDFGIENARWAHPSFCSTELYDNKWFLF